MPTFEDLAMRVHSKSAETITLAETLYQQSFANPCIDFSLTGVVAGRAYYHDWTVRLNRKLLERHPDHMINVTVPHEIAHLVARKVYGPRIKAHGKEWQSVMRDFGLKPDVCHSMDTSDLRRTKRGSEWYECAGCGRKYSLGIKRARQMQATGNTYVSCRCSKGPNLIPLSHK